MRSRRPRERRSPAASRLVTWTCPDLGAGYRQRFRGTRRVFGPHPLSTRERPATVKAGGRSAAQAGASWPPPALPPPPPPPAALVRAPRLSAAVHHRLA